MDVSRELLPGPMVDALVPYIKGMVLAYPPDRAPCAAKTSLSY